MTDQVSKTEKLLKGKMAAAWRESHNLQTDIRGFIDDTMTNPFQHSRHLLNMAFKYIDKQLQSIKDMIKED